MYEVDAFEKGFEPGEIFRFVKRMNEGREGKSKIVRVWRVFILPDGTRAGVVRLDKIVRARAGGTGIHYSWDLPFKGETLIEEIRGKSIIGVNPYTISFTRDGKLVYKARLKDGRCVIVKGDTIISKIQGMSFTSVNRLFILPDGRLAGDLGFGLNREGEVKKVLPFKGRRLITEIGGRKIEEGCVWHVRKDGTLVGTAFLKYRKALTGMREVPFKGDILLDKIKGEKVLDTDRLSLFTLPDGTLVGEVRLEDGRCLIFKDNNLIEEMGGKRIAMVGYFYVLSDGTLAGRIRLEGSDKWIIFKGDTLIDRIQGKEFKNNASLQVFGNILYGSVEMDDGRKIPFKENTLIEEINGKKIINVEPQWVELLPDGRMLCGAILEDGRCVILKGDTVIEEIQGRRFKELSRLLALSDGTVAGVVELEDDRWVPFKGDALLEEIEDRKVMHSYLIYSLPDGTFAGQVETLYEEREIHEYFFWHGHEVYIPQPPDPDRARDLD